MHFAPILVISISCLLLSCVPLISAFVLNSESGKNYQVTENTDLDSFDDGRVKRTPEPLSFLKSPSTGLSDSHSQSRSETEFNYGHGFGGILPFHSPFSHGLTGFSDSSSSAFGGSTGIGSSAFSQALSSSMGGYGSGSPYHYFLNQGGRGSSHSESQSSSSSMGSAYRPLFG